MMYSYDICSKQNSAQLLPFRVTLITMSGIENNDYTCIILIQTIITGEHIGGVNICSDICFAQ